MQVASRQEIQKICSQVRRDIVRMVNSVNSGHPGGSLGCTEYLTSLFFKWMKHQPGSFDMDGKGEDLFFLSNGHITPVYYSVLARSGYFPVDELQTFRHINSRLQGHPATAEHLPGVRIATGSLGQGMSVALGAALAKKMNKDDRIVYSLHGDGELQEGQNWEALMFGAHHKVDNLIAAIDYNGKQIDGNTDHVMSLGNLEAKLDSFGWHVLTMNGNDLDDVDKTLAKAHDALGNQKPVAVVMTTVMGCGVDYMEDDFKWHGVAPDDEQLKKALDQLEETLGDY